MDSPESTQASTEKVTNKTRKPPSEEPNMKPTPPNRMSNQFVHCAKQEMQLAAEPP
jgi:hypothetical protein